MSSQGQRLPLFDQIFPDPPLAGHRALTGADLRDSGMESVLKNTSDEYKEKFIGLIRGFTCGYQFTVEEVRELAGDPPCHYNVMGALMRRAASYKLIVRTTERRKAKRTSLHASELTVWRRL